MFSKSNSVRKTVLALTVAATVFAVLPVVSANAATTTTFTVLAKGKAEGAGGGSPTGSVTARFTVNLKKDALCYLISSHGLPAITGVHIHSGAAGMNGGVVVPLDPKAVNTKHTACVTVAAKLLTDIADHASMYYFNAHTAKFPGGAVRSQLATTDAMMK